MENTKNKHLTLDDRIIIQTELSKSTTFKEIAKILGKDPTTISKEIRKRRIIRPIDYSSPKKIEPDSPPSSQRFAALKELADAGIFCGVLMMPILPFINDTEENVLEIVRLAHAAGVKYVYGHMGLTLREGQREFFYDYLDQSFPGLKERYTQLYGNKYQANSPRLRQLYKVFQEECNRLGLLYKMEDITKEYQKDGFWAEQLSLF